MMEKNKRHNPYRDFKKREKQLTLKSIRINKIMNSLSKQNKSQIEENESPKIAKGKYITKWADPLVIVTVVLAFATYMLYREATNQSGISKQAAEAATKAANQAVASNKTAEDNYKLAKQTSEKNESATKKTIDLQKESFQAQINSLKNEQKKFELINNAYLQIPEANIGIFEAGKQLIIKFKISNLGNYPAKIIDFKSIVNTKIVPPPFKDVLKEGKSPLNVINKYVIKGTDISAAIYTETTMSENQIIAVKTLNYEIYFTGFIRFKNMITGKTWRYEFQLDMKPGYENGYIINDNKKL